jgi:hypothetical protein
MHGKLVQEAKKETAGSFGGKKKEEEEHSGW